MTTSKATIATARAAIKRGAEVRCTRYSESRIDDGFDSYSCDRPASNREIAVILGIARNHTKYRVSRRDDGAIIVGGQYHFSDDFIVLPGVDTERAAAVVRLCEIYALATEFRDRFYAARNPQTTEDAETLAMLIEEFYLTRRIYDEAGANCVSLCDVEWAHKDIDQIKAANKKTAAPVAPSPFGFDVSRI